MSASASETTEQTDRDRPEGLEPLTEYEAARTHMTYGKGGVPLYVAIIWVCFLASYVAYMLFYGLPDLSAWGAP